jgi:hypothetical protein
MSRILQHAVARTRFYNNAVTGPVLTLRTNGFKMIIDTGRG